MKLRGTITFEYEIEDEDLQRIYETTDPKECAAIDSLNDPIDMLMIMDPDTITMKIEPAE